MKVQIVFILTVVFMSPNLFAGTLQGIWQGPAEFRYNIPFPYAEYSSEVLQISATDILSTLIIGQQNSSNKQTYKISNGQLLLTDKSGKLTAYEYSFKSNDELQLCSPMLCRDFSRIDKIPNMPQGSHNVPAVNVSWSWWSNGKLQGAWTMPLQIFSQSYNSTDLNGLDFRWNHPSGNMFHLVFFNYLIFNSPEKLNSYGHTMLMALTDQDTGHTPILTGTLEEPAFFKWGEEKRIKTVYKNESIEFRIIIEQN